MRLNVTRGDTISFVLAFIDDDGNAMDLTDAQVFLTVKKNLSDTDADAKIKKDLSNISEPTSGEVTIIFTSIETDLPAGRYFFDVQVIDDGVVSSSGVGILMIKPQVTRRVTAEEES